MSFERAQQEFQILERSKMGKGQKKKARERMKKIEDHIEICWFQLTPYLTTYQVQFCSMRLLGKKHLTAQLSQIFYPTSSSEHIP